MRSFVVLLALASLASPAAAQSLEEVYKTKKWAEVLRLADEREPTAENDFWAARALRNMNRHEEARERYLRAVRRDPNHADAAIEAALMLIAPLEQVAHDDAERELAVRAARELEEVATKHAADPANLARASYIAGNTWAIAERDGLAAAAYERAIASGDSKYASKALERKAELVFRSLDAEEAERIWRRVIAEHANSSAARSAGRALQRVALVGKPAPKLEVELWAKGPPFAAEDFQGKVTLVYAFAVWCPHCKRELPHAAKLLDHYRERGFQVVGLTANKRTQTTGDVFPFVADPHYRMDYPVAVDQEERTTTAFQLTGLPSAALVDRKGLVRWVGHPNNLTEAAVQALLAEGAPAKG